MLLHIIWEEILPFTIFVFVHFLLLEEVIEVINHLRLAHLVQLRQVLRTIQL